MGYVREQLSRGSARATGMIARRWGDELGMWVGCGYPKSGTVWMCQLMAGYLDIPHPRNYLMPIAMASVIHGHWRYDSRLPRCLYIHRDGRDVMVSFYFHRMAALHAPARPRAARARRARYENAFGAGFDPQDVVANLPRFIELEMTDPWDSRINWPAHIDEWSVPGHPNVYCLSYERLLVDPLPTLTAAFEHFLDEPVDQDRLRVTVARYDFSRQAGRRRGEEDRSSFHRKGIAGDWRNYFSREAAETFDHYAGSTLRRLGHESDDSWVKECPL